MGAQHSIIKRTMVIALETTPGTAETLESADFDILFRDIEITRNAEIESDSKPATGDHTEDVDIAGKTSMTVSAKVKVVYSGTAATEPKWGKAMKACGASAVTYTTYGVGYQPLKAGDEVTATIWVIDEEIGASPAAVAYKLVGAMGNAVIHADTTGGAYMIDFTFTGKEVAPDDIATGSLLALTSPDSTVGEKLLGNPASVFGVDVCISKFSLDIGNEVTGLECQSDATGYKYFYISSRKPRMTIDPYAVATTTRDPYTLFTSETTGVLGVYTSAANPHISIVAPVAQLISPALGSQSEAVKSEETYKCIRNDGSSISDLTNVEATWELLHGARAGVA